MKKERIERIFLDAIELLACAEHERWAHWQKYLHSKCVRQADGSLLIPSDLVERWERMISTPYDELTETEKQSDREQVERYLPIIAAALEEDENQGSKK